MTESRERRIWEVGELTGHLLTQPGQKKHLNIIPLSFPRPHFRER